jgi:hypothetical protein
MPDPVPDNNMYMTSAAFGYVCVTVEIRPDEMDHMAKPRYTMAYFKV